MSHDKPTVQTNQEQFNAVLETECPICKGAVGRHDGYESWYCHNCRGAGYVPTEFGEKVLDLIRHNLKLMLQDTQND